MLMIVANAIINYNFRYIPSARNDNSAKKKNEFKFHNFVKSSTQLPQPKEEKNTFLDSIKTFGNSITPSFKLPNLFQEHAKISKTEHVYSSDNDIWRHALRR